MGRYYETFVRNIAVVREGPPIPDYQRAYAFDNDVSAVDARLHEAIRLRLEPLARLVPLEEIEIQVHRGFVDLRGPVPSARLKTAVAAFVDNTVGVRGVRNDLSIQVPARQGAAATVPESQIPQSKQGVRERDRPASSSVDRPEFP